MPWPPRRPRSPRSRIRLRLSPRISRRLLLRISRRLSRRWLPRPSPRPPVPTRSRGPSRVVGKHRPSWFDHLRRRS
ncbi:hypothetical protein F3K39_29005 [Streptomyces sp. LBUM 1479]|nr:hypothetical protein [Streptomyces sp. LBUM 1479]